MNAFKLFDAYSLRARLFPALLASGTLLVAIGLLVPWHRLSVFHGVATIAVPVILFAMADIARRIGKKREPSLYQKWGGLPTTRMMRHADDELDADTKAAYLGFIARNLNAAVPTAQEEAADLAKADAFYSRCGAWLRENTRDKKKFAILFGENVTYGFRRNLFALKWPALAIDGLIMVGALAYALYARPAIDSEAALKVIILMAVAVIHAAYIVFASTESSVREAANTYARQLLLCCEAFGAPKSRKRAATK